jgi:hypothetical protein
VKGNGAPGPPSPADPTEAAAKHKAESILANKPAVFAPIRAAVDGAIGRAIAGVLLDKPADEVTPEEAAAALAKPVAKGDPERTNRAIRAGMRAMAMKLESRLVAPKFLGLLVGVTKRLDAGEWRRLGWASPAKTARRKSPGVLAEEALWFTVEIIFLQAAYDISLDEAIGRATGVRRPSSGGRSQRSRWSAAPTMPARSGWGRTTIQAILQLGEETEPEAIADARQQGLAARTGDVAFDFFAIRLTYLLTWRALLKQAASKAAPEGKRRRGTPRRG